MLELQNNRAGQGEIHGYSTPLTRHEYDTLFEDPWDPGF